MAAKYTSLTDDLYRYMAAHRSDARDPVLDALEAETANLGEVSRMAISRDQGSFITFLAATLGAKWALEVGTFTGSSSIGIARGLVSGGKLICYDQDFKWTSIARRYWMKAGVHEKIELRLGNAHDLLPRLRPIKPLDFVFIDADKEYYDFYYETLLPHVRPGGIILFDNMLMNGKVIDPTEKFVPAVRAIDQLNHKLAIDPRIHGVLIPMADGLYLCRKLPPPY
jgi:caffeoyl-CoA O-methyltransferase